MQLQLFQQDSEVGDGVRQLHGRIILNTTSMPDKQDLKFGFLFKDNSASGKKYDGLQVSTKLDHQSQIQSFTHSDISTTKKPNVFAQGSESGSIKIDQQNDWVILQEDSYVKCEDVGHCEISVAFLRNFDTLDSKHDIVIESGEEMEFALVGFYEATDFASRRVTHVGQSKDLTVLMGAISNITSSTLVVATALLVLAAF